MCAWLSFGGLGNDRVVRYQEVFSVRLHSKKSLSNKQVHISFDYPASEHFLMRS
jgi:hypothetical protein